MKEIVLAIMCIIIIVLLIQLRKSKDSNTKINNEIFPYKQKYLLTKNEWKFYKQIKETTDKLNLHILAKVRLADFVEVDKEKANKQFQKYFNYIKSKHIDFVLCNPENLKIIYLIELDDKTHSNEKTIKRDELVNKIYETCNYELIRVKNAEGLINYLNNKQDLQNSNAAQN